ncbi:hypothetical protein [Natrinema sp. DC36]|uniref:hypothetical protein n=1 Tax=Natrinema sp. DC36 TaxID=2878680 RepID=UPI001CF0CE04|nr:hypothetical protein [Natrinema sp. DC36]
MSVSRKVLDGVGPDGIDVRQYTDPDNGVKLPSVTTVLKTRDDDKSNLYAWQDRNDGEGDNAHHEHLFWYKRNRGTLCHWYALKKLDVNLEWSEDEADSFWVLNNIDKINDDSDIFVEDSQLGEFVIDGSDHEEIHDSSPRDVLYSVLKSQHAVETWGEFYDEYGAYGTHDHYSDALTAQCKRDREHFEDVFDEIVTKLGIEDEHVLAVEEFLFNIEDGYAGQVDLVYECPETGDVVVADLKTSSGCYAKHKIQGSAYGNSVEKLLGLDVDRLEVWRIHPDSGQWAVHCHDEPTEIHTSNWWRKSFDDLLSDFMDLADDFEYSE